ncbi:MAG: hypothetical protein AAFW73_00245 [Bacteroidota bacterium]
MSFIDEHTIERVAEKLNQQPEQYEAKVLHWQQQQPELLAYLFMEDTRFLSDDERDFLLYLSLILLESVTQIQPIPPVSSEQISLAEDHNWEQLEKVSARGFRERLDVFFVDYAQEDLLAFVEDALIPDEDSTITKEGREPLFIALKTVIDVVTAQEV